jgi:hypothetical protein
MNQEYDKHFKEAAIREFQKLAMDKYKDAALVARLTELLHGIFLKTR